MPDFSLENEINGICCGLDEVGRGPLAGPVVAACVVIPNEIRHMNFISQLRDSKKISKKKLSALYDLITQHCPHQIASVQPEEIDRINILQASLLGMSRAMSRMNITINHALVDGNRIPPQLPCTATAVIKGDNISNSIAAASIIAKVARDRIMQNLSLQYPHYGWERNAAYPTKEHIKAIENHGITPHHRKSFAPVRRALSR